MPINMTDYKMIYKEQIFNVIQINIVWEGQTYNPDKPNEPPKPKFIDAAYIDEDGGIKVVQDEAWCFQFIRRVEK